MFLAFRLRSNMKLIQIPTKCDYKPRKPALSPPRDAPEKYRRDSDDEGRQQGIRANVLAGNPAIDVQDVAKHGRGQYRSKSDRQEIPEPETSWVHHPTVPLESTSAEALP